MKEAAGEANMTTITIMLIGAIAAVAIPMVQKTMKNAQFKTQCMACGGYMWDRYCLDYGDMIIDPSKNCEYVTGEYDGMMLD